MTYPVTIPIQLGSSQTGLTLTAQLYDPSTGSPTESPITTGFIERANGRYDWTGVLPSAQTTGVAFYNGVTEVASTVVNDFEAYDIISILGSMASIGAPAITVKSVVVAAGKPIELYQGDDYKQADARSLQWTLAAGTVPDITGGSVSWHAASQVFVGSILVSGISGDQKVQIELTHTQTSSMAATENGRKFQLIVTLASGDIATVVPGTLIVHARV